MARKDERAAPARAGRITWSTEMKEAFLDHLAATCNVKASAAIIAVEPGAAYGLRRTNATFRAAWAKAVECGYGMLETQLIGQALANDGPQLTNGDVAKTGSIDVPLALTLLTQHRGRRDAAREKDGPTYKAVSAEQTNASILRKLKAMERYRAARR